MTETNTSNTTDEQLSQLANIQPSEVGVVLEMANNPEPLTQSPEQLSPPTELPLPTEVLFIEPSNDQSPALSETLTPEERVNICLETIVCSDNPLNETLKLAVLSPADLRLIRVMSNDPSNLKAQLVCKAAEVIFDHYEDFLPAATQIVLNPQKVYKQYVDDEQWATIANNLPTFLEHGVNANEVYNQLKQREEWDTIAKNLSALVEHGVAVNANEVYNQLIRGGQRGVIANNFPTFLEYGLEIAPSMYGASELARQSNIPDLRHYLNDFFVLENDLMSLGIQR